MCIPALLLAPLAALSGPSEGWAASASEGLLAGTSGPEALDPVPLDPVPLDPAPLDPAPLDPEPLEWDGPIEALAVRAPEHGLLPWFDGSWEELLRRAEREERLVFVEFWTEWCGWCKQLDKDTFSNPTVVRAMGDLLCFTVDGESEEGAKLRERFGVRTYPTLVFLEPNGEPRDVLTGYLAPKPFLQAVERIRRNEGTLSALRRRIAEAPDDLDARHEYATKLRKLGDSEGYAEQVAAIRRRDPEGLSVATRTILLREVLDKAFTSLELAPLYDFVEAEVDGELLATAWHYALVLENRIVQNAETEEVALPHRRRWMRANHSLWSCAKEEDRAEIGNFIAWGIYVQHEHLGAADLRFGLEVARIAAGLAPEDASIVDTLACMLFAVGEREEACETVRRCIQLEEDNPEWRRRLEEFLSR